MFEKIFGSKSWYQSLTAWGLVIVAAAEAAVRAGLLGEANGEIATMIGAIATALGLRKAATSQNVR